MTKNQLTLTEFLILSTKCEYCGMTAQYGGGIDCEEASEDLDANGWRVVRDKVKCPKCVQKSKRKK